MFRVLVFWHSGIPAFRRSAFRVLVQALLDKVHLTNLEKFTWLFVAILWNDLTMERNDRIPDTLLTRKKLADRSVVIVIHNHLLSKVSHNENREL